MKIADPNENPAAITVDRSVFRDPGVLQNWAQSLAIALQSVRAQAGDSPEDVAKYAIRVADLVTEATVTRIELVKSAQAIVVPKGGLTLTGK